MIHGASHFNGNSTALTGFADPISGFSELFNGIETSQHFGMQSGDCDWFMQRIRMAWGDYSTYPGVFPEMIASLMQQLETLAVSFNATEVEVMKELERQRKLGFHLGWEKGKRVYILNSPPELLDSSFAEPDAKPDPLTGRQIADGTSQCSSIRSGSLDSRISQLCFKK